MLFLTSLRSSLLSPHSFAALSLAALLTTGCTGVIVDGGAIGEDGSGTPGDSTSPSSWTFGDWHVGWALSWPTTLQDRAIGRLGPTGATVGGYFSGVITFPDNQFDAGVEMQGYVARVDKEGQIAWSQIITGQYGAYIQSVDTDALGRSLVGGNFFNEVTIGEETLHLPGSAGGFAALLDTDGSLLWARTFGTTDGADVEQTRFAPDGSVIVTGHYIGAMDLDGAILPSFDGAKDTTVGDIYVTKLSIEDGSRVWARGYGGTGIDFLSSLDLQASGDLVVSGLYTDSLDLGTGPLAAAPVEGFGYVARLSGVDGSPLFSRSLGFAYCLVAAAPDGSYYCSGVLDKSGDMGSGPITSPTLDMVVTAYGANDAPLWTKQYGDASVNFVAGSYVSAASGGLAAAWGVDGSVDFGDGMSTAKGGEDMWITAFPPDGTEPLTMYFGSAQNETPYMFTLGADNSALIVGSVSGVLDFSPADHGTGIVTGDQGGNTFLLYLVPN